MVAVVEGSDIILSDVYVIAIGAMVDRLSTLVKEGRGQSWTCSSVA